MSRAESREQEREAMGKKMYKGRKFQEKRAAFKANVNFRNLEDGWDRLDRVPRAELVRLVLEEMGANHVRFLGHLLDVHEKTIRLDYKIGGLAPAWKQAIVSGQSVAHVLEMSRVRKEAEQLVPAPPPSAVGRTESGSTTQATEPHRSHSERDELLDSLRIKPNPRQLELDRAIKEGLEERQRLREQVSGP
jgi:hypothetical protein